MTIERVSRNDFTPEELDKAMSEGQTVDTPIIRNKNYDEESKAWFAKYGLLKYRTPEYDAAQKLRPNYFVLDEDGNYQYEEEKLVPMKDGDQGYYDLPEYLHGFGHLKEIDSGNLGDGHEAWVLFEHVESGRLFRKEGWYSSWDDGGFDEGKLEEVAPAEVKVVRYKSIKSGTIFDNPAVTV